jgi:Xaa-Pro aminopeptidase
MASWTESGIQGPDGEDWRVPVSELEARLELLSIALQDNSLPGVFIQHPVDLYYFAGGRQNATLFVPAKGSEASIEGGGNGPVLFVRRSISRAKYEAGESNAPFDIQAFPRMNNLVELLRSIGVLQAPALQFGEIPSSFIQRFTEVLSPLGSCGDATEIIHNIREIKSDWEIEQMKISSTIQAKMFDAVEQNLAEGISELELVAAAEQVSRTEGFGGNIQMRRYPLQCDRGVIVSGRAGGIPSFFDSAVGGTGAHPLAGMGSGFNKIKSNEPILVDLVHVHRGYVVDKTRMFSVGKLSQQWHERLDHMIEVSDAVVASLASGDECSMAWEKGSQLAYQLGYEENLMGMKPDQSRFLGHSVGLQLDESPVVAKGFNRSLPVGGTMAIEPKVVYFEGSIGVEDTWIKTSDNMECLTRLESQNEKFISEV